MQKRNWFFGWLVAIVALPAVAATADFPTAHSRADSDELSSRLAMAHQYYAFRDRIRDSRAGPRWLKDGEQFVYWAATGPLAGTWVRVNARTQSQTPLIAGKELSTQLSRHLGGAQSGLDNPRFALSPDERQIVFMVAEQAFALDLATRRVSSLPADAPLALGLEPGNLYSPSGQTLAAARPGGGFAVLDAKGQVLVAQDGESHTEWQIPAKAWSPNGRDLLVWRSDTRRVHQLPVVDYGTALESVTWVPYPKTGTPLPRLDLHHVDVVSGQLRRIAVADADHYTWLAGWRPDGSEALLLSLSRDGKQLDLLGVDPASGHRRLILRELRPETYVGAFDFAESGWTQQLVALPDNRRFLWLSERDGWKHVYLYDYTGRLHRRVTQGDFPVHEVVGLTPAADAVLVLASAETTAPYDRLLYSAPLPGGKLQKLSSSPGLHWVTLSPSNRYFVDGHSSRTQPRIWEAGTFEGASTFVYAQADASALASLHYAPPEPITTLAVDGASRLHGVLYKPWDFDPRKRYPVIDYIYAGPFVSVVPWSFVGTPESRTANALAQMGFIVMVLDARGTPGRGKAFQDANYGRLGQIEIPDHIAALRQVAGSRPYMDLSRVGIHGHSWGGYFALRGMLTAPEFFKAGYAGAPGALEEEAILNEPHLGLITQHPEAYAAGSNTALAGNLRGPLKIMHGTGDVSAPLSATMRMVDALIKADKPFELLVMPGVGHSPNGAAGQYYKEDVFRFFARVLGEPE